MDNVMFKKIIGVIGIAILLLNMLFVALRVYSHLVFWVIIIIVAVLAFVLTKLLK